MNKPALLFCSVASLALLGASLPPMPPMPPGFNIGVRTNGVRVPPEKLPAVPDTTGRRMKSVVSELPKARWTEGITGQPGTVIPHDFTHSKETGTVTLSWPSQPGEWFALDYAADKHLLFYPWPETVGAWTGTNRTSFAVALPGHPGYWRVRRL